jgi:2-methylcitrate dehydratase PrpD
VQSLQSFATQMGPKTGSSEFFFTSGSTSPAFAALVNGGASHVVELDDLNNAGMIHPVYPSDQIDGRRQ